MTTISADGASNNIYLQMSGSFMQYSVGSVPGSWTTISAWPVTITNSNLSSTSILDVIVTTTLTFTNTYGNTNGYFIAGSTYITFNGSGNTININDISSYPGLIQNGTSSANGSADVVVKNFVMGGTNSTLSPGTGSVIPNARAAGWLCQGTFGRGVTGNQILNCTNNNPINGTYCGGIVGSHFAYGINSSATISNCVNNGAVSSAQTAGIVGEYAGNSNGEVFIVDCSNNAVISSLYSGGICAQSAAQGNGYVKLIRCANTGIISGVQAGGIMGQGGAFNNGLLVILNCTNSGAINGYYSGGITGQGFGAGGVGEITSCTNSGLITGESAGGIVGWQCAKDGGIVSITSCTNTSTATISGAGAGGIAGALCCSLNGVLTLNDCLNDASINSIGGGGILGNGACGNETTGNGQVNVDSCRNTGLINAANAGGIAGIYAGTYDGRASFTDCINSGAINASSAGGIVGSYAGDNGGNLLFSNCENTGEIRVAALYAGGITGAYFANGANSEMELSNCTNSGAINGSSAGGIVGYQSGNNGGALTLIDCINNGDISGSHAGGIIGYQSGNNGTTRFTGCRNNGDISGKYSGGIIGMSAGQTSNMIFTTCINSGNINAVSAGGIAGEQCKNATFDRCENSGIVNGLYAGGIAGASAAITNGNVTFTMCTNSGYIYAESGGGISGYQSGNNGNILFETCTNQGEIIAQYSGGIAGSYLGMNGGYVILTNCENSAEISGNYAGGIAGQYVGYNGGSVSFTTCINNGAINTRYGGGIAGLYAGHSGEVTFTTCTNSRTISIVAQNAGGIAGQYAGAYGNATFTGCENSGLVGAWYSGGIAGGYAGYRGVARFEACENTGNISVNGDYGGGIAGANAGIGVGNIGNLSSAIFIDCKNSGGVSKNSAGGIAGYLVGSEIGGKATFTNCTNSGIINGLNDTGGITGIGAGQNGGRATFTNCTNSGEIVTSGSGGIAGKKCGTTNGIVIFTGCINNGNVNSVGGGGITGEYAGYQFGLVTFTGCVNNGNVNAVGAGGIAGQYLGVTSELVTFTACTNNGEISAYYIGGIAGRFAGSTTGNVTFTNCINNGIINNTAQFAGGIAGDRAGENGTVAYNYCKNTASINAQAAGGITGASTAPNSSSNATFSNCTNSGPVNGFGAGGICGGDIGANNGDVTFTNCTNTAVISGDSAGGVTGYNAGFLSSNSVIFDNCMNSGRIISPNGGGIVGGYAGKQGGMNINRCFNIGYVSGEYAGGITGWKFAYNSGGTSIISNCYTTGDIYSETQSIKAGGIVGGDVGYNNFGGSVTPKISILNCYSLGLIGSGCGGIVGGINSSNLYTNNAILDVSNCYSYGVLNGTGEGIVALSALTSTKLTRDISYCYIANGFWSDAAANASLLAGTTPTNINTGNPGSVWTTLSTPFSPNIPYVLSAFNSQLYSPTSASSNVNFSTNPGLFQPDFNYKIINSPETINVITTRVFAYKGISPYYYSYNSNIFTFTNTNGISGDIYVAVVVPTGVLNYTLPVINEPVITQNPNPFNPYALSPGNIGEVTYTDASYIIIPNIATNPTYVLSTDITDRTFDIFQASSDVPAAFIPNSLFIENNLIAPGGIVMDSAGNFYIGNISYNVISVYDNNGSYLREISIYSAVNVPLLKISYIAMDESDNLYVTSESNTGVYVVPAGSSTNDLDETILKYIYGNDFRGLACNTNYLYIVKQSTPKYVIKYNLTNKNYLQIPLTSASPTIPSTSEPIAILYNNINSTPTLYISTIDGSNNRIYSISNISGNETITGGTGSATISSNTHFADDKYPYSITMDNSANLYVGLDEGRILPVNVKSVGQIARITSTGTISNTSFLTYNGLGIGRPLGLLFEGNNTLYVTDILHDYVIKSQPKTFQFGPAVLNADAFYIDLSGDQYKTYLYDLTDSIIETSFILEADCFQKGTQVLCENNVYVPIENIKIGDLVKTYKHGYQKVIMCKTTHSCDYVRNSKNEMRVYKKLSNPDLIEDLYLTGGHSLLLDTLSNTELKEMKEALCTDINLMVEDKYKLMCCFNNKMEISPKQNVELYRIALEPPENAKPSHVYGIWANGILSESNSVKSMEN